MMSKKVFTLHFYLFVNFIAVLQADVFETVLLRNGLFCFAFSLDHYFFISLVDSFDIQAEDGDIFAFLTFLSLDELYLLEVLLFAMHEHLFVAGFIIVLCFFFGSPFGVEKIEIQ
jgi:hypothetical protein